MRPKVAFIFSQFPCYDEVFILREMVELNRMLDLTILSLKKSARDPVRHQISRPLLDKTVYSDFFFSKEVLRANIAFLLRSPVKFLKSVLEVILLNRRSIEFLLKTLALHPQAVFFASICEKNKIERVHGQWATYPTGTAMIVSRLLGIPFSFTGHAHDIYVNTAGLTAKLSRAQFVITCTGENKRHLLSLAPGLDPEKIQVIYHGVDLEHYRLKPQFRLERGEKIAEVDTGGQFRILSVGSLFECKGFEYLIEACRLLRENNFPFRCRIVGGGYLENNLRHLVSNLRLQDLVEITGYQPQERMPGHYLWADLFILPAVLKIHWGIPNVLLEALAVGVPVACTELPSLVELVENPRCGFIIPEKNPEAIAELIMKSSADRKLLEKYGRAGRKKIEEKWDIKKTAGRIAALFNR